MDALLVEAITENIDEVIDYVFACLGDCPPRLQNQIGVAVDEIFANICMYAYNPDVGKVVIRIDIDENITIEFEDGGVAYDPLTATKNPDTTAAIEDREIGGLGVHIVKNIMDSVEYRHVDNKNILTIKKKME